MAALISLMLSPSPQDRPDFFALVAHPLYQTIVLGMTMKQLQV